MRLRKLEQKDAEYMLEWMHDADVVKWLQADFASKTIEDCEAFIKNSRNNEESLNLAIVDDEDEYMGTVSLKHIDRSEKTAEFAITIRKKAMGAGISKYGMEEILRIGLEELGLDAIYWCVSIENQRAIRFYNKGVGVVTTDVPKKILEQYEHAKPGSLLWYVKR